MASQRSPSLELHLLLDLVHFGQLRWFSRSILASCFDFAFVFLGPWLVGRLALLLAGWSVIWVRTNLSLHAALRVMHRSRWLRGDGLTRAYLWLPLRTMTGGLSWMSVPLVCALWEMGCFYHVTFCPASANASRLGEREGDVLPTRSCLPFFTMTGGTSWMLVLHVGGLAWFCSCRWAYLGLDRETFFLLFPEIKISQTIHGIQRDMQHMWCLMQAKPGYWSNCSSGISLIFRNMMSR